MAHTVTILADSKGFTRPRVSGDEYVVDAVLDITSYTANGEEILATALGLSTINCVVVTGISVDTLTGGYEARMIAPEVMLDSKYTLKKRVIPIILVKSE